LTRLFGIRTLAIAACAALLALALATTGAGAQIPPVSITLSGANEVPPVTTTATAKFTASWSGNSLVWSLTGIGTGLTAAHLHVGAAGTNGAVVLPLFAAAAPGSSTINVSGTARAADLTGPLAGKWPEFVAAFVTGGLYANAHTVTNPGGEMRAQLPGTAPAAGTTTVAINLEGRQENPPTTSTGTGTFVGTFSGTTLTYTLLASGTAITASHIHVGAVGTNGGIVVPFFAAAAPGVAAINQSATVDVSNLSGSLAGNFAGLLTALRAGQLYVNVHTVANAGGDIRGQIPGAAAAPVAAPSPSVPSLGDADASGRTSDGYPPLLMALGGALAVAGAGTAVQLRRVRRRV
jgi:hypothetical protein